MRKKHHPSIFFDISAAVDREEESGDDDEDEDEGSSEEYDADLKIVGAPSLIFPDDDDPDVEAAFEGLHRRALARGARFQQILSSELLNSPSDSPSTTSFHLLHNLDTLPDLHDRMLFCIPVKHGKESKVVFQLMRKAIEGFGQGVASVFFVPRSPGRIYVEASTEDIVHHLASHIQNIFLKSLFLVPITERVALLQPSMLPPVIQKGDLVKLRNGLYKDDFGELIEFSEGNLEATIKLRSREPNHLRTQTQKRKRGRTRLDSYVLNKEDIRRRHSMDETVATDSSIIGSSFIDLGAAGFIFNRRPYTNDGYLLYFCRIDRLERVHKARGGAAISSEDNVFMNVRPDGNNETLRPQSPTFFCVGDRVRVTNGASKGAVGIIVEITAISSALVDLRDADPETKRSVLLEANVAYLERIFEIGDSVEIKIGKHKGVVGVVAGNRNNVLHIVNTKDFSEFEIPTSHAGAPEPEKFDKHPMVTSQNIDFGWPVKICRGKHAGKTGRILFVDLKYVRVLEDVTHIELAVRKDNVEIFEESLTVSESRPASAGRHGVTCEAAVFGKDLFKVSTETATKRCSIDHFKDGFEGQLVYIWQGMFKGRLGHVNRMSGTLARVQLDSSKVLDITTDCLVAECACVLDSSVKLPWSENDKDKISTLFDRTVLQEELQCFAPSPEPFFDLRREVERSPTPPFQNCLGPDDADHPGFHGNKPSRGGSELRLMSTFSRSIC
ncbi:hypothetical protein SCHPADRAFT_269380 [Schizopora paradoxa]|uniref:Chromatin elongation factor SPT5 n=1 Tax=Schizopora paradoxa TaxID=27342 RepID=A0A0H2SE37_9AGAM|nr:hypothetical protein SCHPADRAFT_269380 [Schizopora paradoxa]